MCWKIGLHFYRRRPAKWKKNNLGRAEKDEKKYLKEWSERAGPQDLYPVTSIKEKPLCHTGDSPVVCQSVFPSIYHQSHKQWLLL